MSYRPHGYVRTSFDDEPVPFTTINTQRQFTPTQKAPVGVGLNGVYGLGISIEGSGRPILRVPVGSKATSPPPTTSQCARPKTFPSAPAGSPPIKKESPKFEPKTIINSRNTLPGSQNTLHEHLDDAGDMVNVPLAAETLLDRGTESLLPAQKTPSPGGIDDAYDEDILIRKYSKKLSSFYQTCRSLLNSWFRSASIIL